MPPISRHKLRDRVSLVNAAEVVGYGGVLVRDWATAVVVADVPALLQFLGSTELLLDRDTATTTWRLVLEPTAAISAASRVRSPVVPGRDLEVSGVPGVIMRGGSPHHIEALLQLVDDAAANG